MSTGVHSIGANLRRARVERELSLARVASEAGVSVATLSRVETEKQSVDVALLVTLARILGLSAAELLGEPATDDPTALARGMARLSTADRTKVFLDASRYRDGKQLGAILDDLVTTIDLMREELLRVQQSVRQRKR